MLTKSKSLVARTALALVALAGVVAAVPASARSFDGDGRGGREHDRVAVERDYRQVDYRPVEYGYVGNGAMLRWSSGTRTMATMVIAVAGECAGLAHPVLTVAG